MEVYINVNIHMLKYLLSSVTPGRAVKAVNHLSCDKLREDPAFKVMNLENEVSVYVRMNSPNSG